MLNKNNVTISPTDYAGGLEIIVNDPELNLETVIRVFQILTSDTHSVSIKTEQPNSTEAQPLTEIGVSFDTALERLSASQIEALAVRDLAGKVFTYDALVDKEFLVGDRVVCPIGIINGEQTDTMNGTVVTLNPAPTKFKKRLITDFA